MANTGCVSLFIFVLSLYFFIAKTFSRPTLSVSICSFLCFPWTSSVPILFHGKHRLCQIVHLCAFLVFFIANTFSRQTLSVSICSFLCFPWSFSVPILFHGRYSLCQFVHFCAFLGLFECRYFSWQTPSVSTCSSLCFLCIIPVPIHFYKGTIRSSLYISSSFLVPIPFLTGYHMCQFGCFFLFSLHFSIWGVICLSLYFPCILLVPIIYRAPIVSVCWFLCFLCTFPVPILFHMGHHLCQFIHFCCFQYQSSFIWGIICVYGFSYIWAS